MHAENTVFIHGAIEEIFALAADIQDWPTLLPHYRAVSVLESSDAGRRKVVEMAAVRPNWPVNGVNFPVRWRSVQIVEPSTHKIYFKHLAGVAVGMWVVWSLTPDPWGRGVRVTIAHDLTYPFSILNGWFAQDLVGLGFVEEIAGRTLSTLKGIVEGDART